MVITFYIVIIIILAITIFLFIKSLFSPSKSNITIDNESIKQNDIEVNGSSRKKTLSKIEKDSTPPVKVDVETVIAGAILYDAFSGDDSNESDSNNFDDYSSSFECDNDDSSEEEIDTDEEEDDDFDFLF